MIARLLRAIGWRTIANLALLFTLFGSLVWGLTSIVKGLESGLISITILICTSLALVLSRLQVSSGRAALILSVSGGIGLIYYFAGLATPLQAILRALNTIPKTLWASQRWPDLTPLISAWQQLLGQLGDLFARAANWLSAMMRGQPGFDIVAATFTWGLMLWLITAWAAWGILRLHRPLPAIAPAGILLSGTLNYTNGSATILLPFLGATLLLMALSRYETEQDHWEHNRIDYAEDIRLDMALMIPLIVLGLIIFAAFTPSISISHITRLVRKAAAPYQSQAEHVGDAIGINQVPASLTNLDALRSPGLPQQHLLGAGAELSQQLVMIIRTGDLPPVANPELLPYPPEPYYWRSLTYDIYTGRGWATSSTETIQYQAGHPAVQDLPPESSSIRIVEQRVQFPQAGPGVLYAAGMLVAVNDEYEVAWRTPLEDVADIFGATTQAQQYLATSVWLTPSVEQLRSAPLVYPDWIRERYLTLPDILPQRVYNLAMELTRGNATPYDRAVALEAYLRSYPYSLDVPAPPPNKDVTDYFLFELRQGYCDYYATAMVVLSRAAGLPARLVSGYSTGTYDPTNARYIVTANHAHSWAEIYFSGIGWVEFEPTGGYPVIVRPTATTDPSLSIVEPKPVQRYRILRWLENISWITWILFACSGAITLLISREVIYAMRLQRLSAQRALAEIYRDLIQQGDRLAIERHAGDTPAEYTTRFRIFLNSLSSRKDFNALISPAGGQITNFVKLYHQGFYSASPLSPTQVRQAALDWSLLRWRLIAVRIILRSSIF